MDHGHAAVPARTWRNRYRHSSAPCRHWLARAAPPRSSICYKPCPLHRVALGTVDDPRGYETHGSAGSNCCLLIVVPLVFIYLSFSYFRFNASPERWENRIAMTRTEPVNSSASWETKSIATTDDGHRLDSGGQDARPRGRIRRSMTACHTCRKLKTRCDLDPRGHACRRCLSLR